MIGCNLGLKLSLFRGISQKTNIRAQKSPSFKQPMLATLTKQRFSDPNWIFEDKLDGVRCIVVKRGKRAFLYSRNRNNLNANFPELLKRFPAKIHFEVKIGFTERTKEGKLRHPRFLKLLT